VAVSTDATTDLLNIDVKLQQACSTFHMLRAHIGQNVVRMRATCN